MAYAEPFADAGFHAFVFDYRGFGDSEGALRQDVSVRRQRQDYHGIVLWGTSYAGGHVIAVAARDARAGLSSR